jgi:hypothetical protein
MLPLEGGMLASGTKIEKASLATYVKPRPFGNGGRGTTGPSPEYGLPIILEVSLTFGRDTANTRDQAILSDVATCIGKHATRMARVMRKTAIERFLRVSQH